MKTNKLTIGILAHVDSGKTTLSEAILYSTGSIRNMGRVDHKNAFLDTYKLEKDRGITIFSKQAIFSLGDYEFTLLDTPGHVDFSSEMERTLQVLEYAILLVNGADGIQGHTQTLWKLLEQYKVPTFIFVNKMDQVGPDPNKLLEELKGRFSEECIDFSEDISWDHIAESVAMSDETLLEAYIENGTISSKDIMERIGCRGVYPVYFGSALNNSGVDTLLEGLEKYTKPKEYIEDFGARVFNISRDEKGNRLTHLKITGGVLCVKDLLSNQLAKDEINSELKHVDWQEKVDQIRIYSGKQYQLVQQVEAGSICAVTGLTKVQSGQGLGYEKQVIKPELKPILSYAILLPEGENVMVMLKNLRQLEEEEPHLNIFWNESLEEIQVQVMGEIEIEILKSMILERYGVAVEFGKGNLVYKETIKDAVIGVGHFEPLKHYAEVHLLIEPLERASGIVLKRKCSEDVLGKNWQQLILSHLQEKSHKGVLTGAEITDVKITVVAGKSHKKHTEGGDFRRATFRALRQGLRKAESVLLEPVYSFSIEVPTEYIGRAMTDIQRINGSQNEALTKGDRTIITGTAPVAQMMHYGSEISAYSKGEGKLNLRVSGYEVCHNSDQVIEENAYDPDEDPQNPCGSIFCKNGVGYTVPWDEVENYMHVNSGIQLEGEIYQKAEIQKVKVPSSRGTMDISEEEIEKILSQTYRTSKGDKQEKKRRYYRKKSQNIVSGNDDIGLENRMKTVTSTDKVSGVNSWDIKGNKDIKTSMKYLLVDGYNIIFNWDELKSLANDDLDLARVKLLDLMSNYEGQTDRKIIVVFDAYRVKGGRVSKTGYDNIFVVFTKEAQTADHYIERWVHRSKSSYDIIVATSDRLEQVIILAKGAKYMSAEGLREEVFSFKKDVEDKYLAREKKIKNQIKFDRE